MSGAPGAPGRVGRLSEPFDVADFLGRHPPFDSLSDEELRQVASAATEQTYRTGQLALIMFGEPTRYLFVVKSGAMDLVHGEETIEVIEPGECFGHPSLVSGLSPTFSVRAREDSTCLLIPGDVAMRVLARPAGARYVARSLRDRMLRTEQTTRGLPELSITRVGAVAQRPPVTVNPDATVREVARALTEANAAAAYVQLPDGAGIVSDADLRERVLAAGLGADDPVRVAVSTPAICVAAESTVGEALVELLDARRREALVTERGQVVGVLSMEDIAGGERSVFSLRREIEKAADEDALVEIVTAGVPRLQASLLAAGLDPVDVSRALVVQSDTVTARLVDFAFAEHGPAPVPWAWMGLGSVARRELTLASDQDNALAYADGEGPEVDEFFAKAAEVVNAGLARCGFGEDNADVLARDRRWRMSAEEWRTVMAECLEYPDRSHLVRAAVSFDFRHVMGGLEIVPPLVEVMRQARQHRDFIRQLARTATDWEVPLGRRGSLATDRDGRIDVKKGGTLPIANLARLHSLSAGVTISPTLDRLVAAEDLGQLDRDTAASLREAFGIVLRVRHEHHAACFRAGVPADNRVDPSALSAPRRAELTAALHDVAAAQKRLAVVRPLGM
jgi:CBS domain-containing protein